MSGSLSKVAEVPVGTESYQATPLVNGTTYLFAVSAIDDSDNASPLSVEVSATPAPIVVLARATGQITSQFSTIRLWRGADPVEAASLTLNGTDYTDSGGGTYKVTLPAFMVPGDPIDLDIAIGAESIEGTETFPPDVTVSSPADGASYSAGVDVDVAWTVAEEPDAFFLQVTCTGGACSHPADTLEIDLAGDLTSYTIPSGDLVTNGVYTLRLDAINLVDLTGDFHIDSSIPVINTLPGPSSPTIQVVP